MSTALNCLRVALNHYGDDQEKFERIGFKQYTFAAALLELDERLRRVEGLIGTEADWPQTPTIAEMMQHTTPATSVITVGPFDGKITQFPP